MHAHDLKKWQHEQVFDSGNIAVPHPDSNGWRATTAMTRPRPSTRMATRLPRQKQRLRGPWTTMITTAVMVIGVVISTMET